MDIAEIAWVVVGCVIVLLLLGMAIKSLPELRRYLNVRKM
jgi:hypothetical protein